MRVEPAKVNLAFIKQQAAQLLSESGLGNKFPVPVEIIADHLGYSLRAFTPSDKIMEISGAVSRAEKKILVNDDEPYLRQRFTVAHEIGHICLHNHDEEFVDYRKDSPRTLKEYEADEFAGCLLMPEEIFVSKWKEMKKHYQQLSNYFGVSEAAIGMRAYRLGLE